MGTERRDYEGHRIELVSREVGAELLIDDEQVPYGRLPQGDFFLHDYAYDWTDDLMDLAQRWIEYQAKADSLRRGGTDDQ
ncbi:twin-arginine translocation pathway signal protein [Streptomyces tanashiensis]|uniref:twin-arginine translocation pathway signal protein n=1 Tax=Streptomyces tanashiensis TaxID=67367 RepID=UPI00167ECF19|nr:twin-arginine translocation pathway signal protein [Streptomyces tanashiensis]GGY55210.1 hypothetical protein GCM10010299_71870 [Streptomyces tanashiensis]